MWTSPTINQVRKKRRPNQRVKPEGDAAASKRRGLGRWSKVRVKMPFQDDSALRHVPYLVFLTLLGIIYISNSHYAEDMAGRITKMEREVKNLQMEYGTLKYEYMTASNKEEIANRLEEMGLVPNDEHITKIKLVKEE